MAPDPATARLALIVPAAGSSTRMGGAVKKPLIEIEGEPIVCHTLKRFRGIPNIIQVIVATHPADFAKVKSTHWHDIRDAGATALIPGGERRQDTVKNALETLNERVQIVMIHDAVRPFVSRQAIVDSIAAACHSGAAIVAIPVADTVKYAENRAVIETVPREKLWLAQTPQTFQIDLIQSAMEKAEEDKFECTDDAQLVERLGYQVSIVQGSFENFKITTPEHLRVARALLNPRYRGADE